MKKRIFRKSALDELSSPERMSIIYRALSPRRWESVVATLLLILSILVLLWSKGD